MFVIKKRSLVIILTLVVTCITFVICIGAIAGKSVSGTDTNTVKVVLDAGHGGIDGGVSGVSTGAKESELNLKVVKKIEKYLISSGFNVILTRSSDEGLYGLATSGRKKKEMQKRKQIIEDANPDLVVSVHMNKYPLSSRRGAQVFYKKTDEYGKKLAKNIQNSFNSMEEAPRKSDILTGDYFILNCTEYPSVICECGFLSNPEDEALLITEDYQDKIAYAIFKGIIGYLSEESFVFTD